MNKDETIVTSSILHIFCAPQTQTQIHYSNILQSQHLSYPISRLLTF